MNTYKSTRISVRAALAASALLFACSACGSEAGGEERAAAQDPDQSANCGAFTGKIAESADFVPYANRRSRLPDAYVNPEGVEEQEVPKDAAVSRIGELARQFSLVDSNGGSYQYFSATPIDSKTTVAGFQASGGIALEATPAANAGIAEVLEQVGEKRGVRVEVGPHPGVVIWADPQDDSERRMHHVYWEANGYLFGLILDATPEQAVTLSREVACGSLAS